MLCELPVDCFIEYLIQRVALSVGNHIPDDNVTITHKRTLLLLLRRTLRQLGTPVPRTKVAVCRRSSNRPNIFSFTGVSVGQVAFLSFWCIVQSCRRCSTVIGAMPQGHMSVSKPNVYFCVPMMPESAVS